MISGPPSAITTRSISNSLFRERRAGAESLASATSKAAAAQGLLREAHLRYHLAMVDLLTPEQIAEYNRLRGY